MIKKTRQAEQAESLHIIAERIEDYLRFFTRVEEKRFPIFAYGSLGKLCHFVNMMGRMLTLTLKIRDGANIRFREYPAPDIRKWHYLRSGAPAPYYPAPWRIFQSSDNLQHVFPLISF